MVTLRDGPASPYFRVVPFKGNARLDELAGSDAAGESFGISKEMAAVMDKAPAGSCVAWGIPFEIGPVIVLSRAPVTVDLSPTRARWLVFMHTSDVRPLQPGPGGIISPMKGMGQLADHAADYTIIYADGSETRIAIRRRHQLGPFQRLWGENCFEAVAQHKWFAQRGAQEQLQPGWGVSQMRVGFPDEGPWVNWLWAWENPYPEKTISGLRFEPGAGAVVISAISAGDVAELPLRWQTRRKARLALAEGEVFQPDLDADGLLKALQIDLGQVISATPRLVYPNETWANTYNNQLPDLSPNEILIEYTAHPEACFHLFGSAGEKIIPIGEVEKEAMDAIQAVAPADQTVLLRVVERRGGQPVPVKLHVHGEWGEYLAPVDRHRILNPHWFEDYSTDFYHALDWDSRQRAHTCTYISGETRLKLPVGKVYIEVSKGFEINPLRKVVDVTPQTAEITLEIEKVLPWREMGWVTADTHVHFLSPITAMLEGSAEGVNVINLLASQWGEMMSNVGDFDGRSTWGSREAGGDGEYLVRVGTENRQHVLGHISLLGYQGPIILPMTSGGPDESALGDPVEVLLSEWARQCRSQGGVVIMPHFPQPRAEHAAAIVNGDVDGIEMTAWHDLYSGINPYSLSDWYRYLNCGYLVAAVGGTDKMAAMTAVGTVRTYAHIKAGAEFTYEDWKEAIHSGETFVTYGPLLEMSVDGHPMGSRIYMSRLGGTVDVAWRAASVTIPMTRIELVVNGEIRESKALSSAEDSGHWSVRVDKSLWMAVLIRGHQADKPEIITAHSSAVMILVEGSPLMAAADAVTILDQIEGAMAYLDSVGTRCDDRTYKRMRLVLESAHRSLHNRMHQQGQYHEHAGPNAHSEH